MSAEGDESIEKQYCSIESCKYYTGTFDSGVGFFRAPLISTPLRKKWEERLFSNPETKVIHFDVLCQLHFKPEHIYRYTLNGIKRYNLRYGALPLPIEVPKVESTFDPDYQPARDIKIVDIQQIKSGAHDINVVNIKSEPIETNEQQTMIAEIQAEPIGCARCIKLKTHYCKQLQTTKMKMEELSTEIRMLRSENSRLQCLLGLNTDNEAFEPEMKVEMLTSNIDFEGLFEPESAIDFNDIFEPIVNNDTVQLKGPITHINMQDNPPAQTSNGVQTFQPALPPSSKGSHGGIQELFKCRICHENFDTGQELNRHISGHVPKKKRVVVQRTCFECFLCKHKTKKQKELREHMKRHKRNTKCEICNTALTFTELKSHLCGQEKSIECEYCEKRFDVTTDLMQHLKNEHVTVQRLHCCDKCSKFFPMIILKDLHLTSHAQVQNFFRCYVCPKKYTTKYRLRVHHKSHNSGKNFLCDECGKGFLTTRCLEQHKLFHSEPTIQCPDCPKKFHWAANMRRHRDLHRNRKYVCAICGKELPRLDAYRKHMRRHRRTDADRKFACEYCPLRCFNKDDLKKHQVKHTGVKKFHCRFCSQSYKYNGDLNKHLKTHIPDGKIHECPKCPMRFQLPMELRRHSFEHYKEEKAKGLNAEGTS